MAHKHADNMVLYSQDAYETDKPWERWEYNAGFDVRWDACTKHPEWATTHEYRRKPSQDQLDIEAFNDWWLQYGDVSYPSDAWTAALKWERSKK